MIKIMRRIYCVSFILMNVFLFNAIGHAETYAKQWEFNTNANTEGWQALECQISGTGVSNGYYCLYNAWRYVVLLSSDNLNIDISNSKIIKIKYKNTSDSDYMLVSFTTNQHPDLVTSPDKYFINKNDPNFTEYTLDMSDIPEWTGTLKQLTIQLAPNASYTFGGSATRFTLYVDYVRIVDTPASDTQAPTWPNGSALQTSNITQTGLTLTWPSAADNTGVVAYQVLKNGVLFTRTPGDAATTCNITGLQAGTSYTFEVKAADTAGNISSALSQTVSTLADLDTQVPTWPSSSTLQFSSIAQTSLTLAWPVAADNVGVTKYNIYKNGTLLTNVSSSSTTYNVTGLQANTSYTFEVKAADAAGNLSSSISTTVSTLPTDAQNVAAAKAALVDNIIKNGNSALDNVTSNLNLPATDSSFGNTGVSVSWSSNNISAITNTGVVTRPAATASDITVTLTATLTKGAATDTKTFTVVVKKASAQADTQVPIWSTGSTLRVSNITQTSLTLTWPAATDNVGINGYKIYKSGTLLGQTGASTLTYNVTGLQANTSYTFDVKAADAAGNLSSSISTTVSTLPTDAQNVAAAKAALVDNIIKNSNSALDNVTSNLSLPATDSSFGNTGVSVSWSSNNIPAITNAGVVTRPAATASDITVTLTATLTKGAATDTKTFTVVVKKASAQADTQAPTWPSGSTLNVSNIGESTLTLKWPQALDNVGVLKYVIYMNGEIQSILASGTTTMCAIVDLSPSTSYTFGIKAMDSAGNASIMLSASAKTLSSTAAAITDAESITSAKALLVDSVIRGSNSALNNVTSNLSLPSTDVSFGNHGVNISWSSSNTSIITNTGIVTRPGVNANDATITLTATLTKGAAKGTKAFMVVVKKIDSQTGTQVNTKDATQTTIASEVGFATNEKGAIDNTSDSSTIEAALAALDKMGKQITQPNANGNVAEITITQDNIQSLIDKAAAVAEAAKKLETKTKSDLETKITIDIPKIEEVTKVKATIPASLVDSVKSQGIDKIEISSEIASISIRTEAMKTTDTSFVSFSTERIEPKNLTQRQKAIVGSNLVYEFNAVASKKNGTIKKITSFSKPVEIRIPYQLKSGENAERITVFYLNENGIMENMAGKYNLTTKTIAFRTGHFSKYIIKQNTIKFKDVSNAHWAKKCIEVMTSKGITTGVTLTKFGPGLYVTKAAFLNMIKKACGVDLYKKGIRLEQILTKQEMAVMVGEVLNSSAKNLLSQQQLANLAIQKGIVSSKPSKVTRAEAAKVVYQLYNLNY